MTPDENQFQSSSTAPAEPVAKSDDVLAQGDLDHAPVPPVPAITEAQKTDGGYSADLPSGSTDASKEDAAAFGEVGKPLENGGEQTSVTANDAQKPSQSTTDLRAQEALSKHEKAGIHPSEEVKAVLESQGITCDVEHADGSVHMKATKTVGNTTHHSTIKLLIEDAVHLYHEFLDGVLATLGKL